MTIKWVKVDPLVMNGEPFCYGTRLTVRQLLELRRSGSTLVDLLKDHPELRVVGIAAAFAYAGQHRARYAEFFEADGSARRAGLYRAEAAILPERFRIPGVVVKARRPPTGHCAVAHRRTGCAGPSEDGDRLPMRMNPVETNR